MIIIFILAMTQQVLLILKLMVQVQLIIIFEYCLLLSMYLDLIKKQKDFLWKLN